MSQKDMPTQAELVRILVVHDRQTALLAEYARVLLKEKLALEQRLFGGLAVDRRLIQ